MGDWLFNQTGFDSQEADANWKLLSAFEESRNRNSVSLGDRQLLRLRGKGILCAVGKHGRIAWARAVCRELADHFDLGPKHQYPDQPLYWLTLVDYRCSAAHDDIGIDVAPFISRFRKGMSGISHIGMLDAAYYVNIAQGARYRNKQAIFWHVHALVWGLSPREVEALENELNRNYRSIADGLDAARIKRVFKTGGDDYHLAIKLRYMLKSPKHVYRLRLMNDIISPDGEILSRFGQKSTDLRAGERITLFHSMKHLYLDRLTLAGGEGTSLLRRAKRRALPKEPTRPRRTPSQGVRKLRHG